MHWGWYGAGWLGVVWMATFWVGLVLLIVWAVRATVTDRRPERHTALDILEERFARGEIDATEFAARRAELTRS